MRRPNNNSHPQTLSSMGNRPGARSPIGRHDKLVTCAAYSAMHCLDGTLSSNFCPVLQVQNDCESKRGHCARYGPPFLGGLREKRAGRCTRAFCAPMCADVTVLVHRSSRGALVGVLVKTEVRRLVRRRRRTSLPQASVLRSPHSSIAYQYNTQRVKQANHSTDSDINGNTHFRLSNRSSWAFEILVIQIRANADSLKRHIRHNTMTQIVLSLTPPVGRLSHFGLLILRLLAYNVSREMPYSPAIV